MSKYVVIDQLLVMDFMFSLPLFRPRDRVSSDAPGRKHKPKKNKIPLKTHTCGCVVATVTLILSRSASPLLIVPFPTRDIVASATFLTLVV